MIPQRSRPLFSIQQAQAIVKDLHQPNPWIYWTDFLVSVLLGHVFFQATLFAPEWLQVNNDVLFWGIRASLFIVTGLLFLRATIFTHEMVHFRKGTFQGFRIVWNLLCGIPFLIPSFTYYPHIDHHRRKSYGTGEDGEYLELSHSSRWAIIGYLSLSFVIPVIAFIRFSILSPLGWIFPSIYQWSFKHLSTMAMDPLYVRPMNQGSVARTRFIQEVACAIFCWGFVLKGPLLMGVMLDPLWIQAYLMGVYVIFLNSVRTLGAHRWTSAGEESSFEEQLLDSLNYPYRPWFTELWGPVGTRYHALHHLFPTLPYHNLGIAHRRLMAELPEDSLYRKTVRVSLLSELLALWSRAKHHEQREAPQIVEAQRKAA
jgi:fatty acid desaturase